MNTNAAHVWELLNTYAHKRREGHSHTEASLAVRGLAVNSCNSAEMDAAIELGAALEWWGARRLPSDSDLVVVFFLASPFMALRFFANRKLMKEHQARLEDCERQLSAGQ